MEELALNVLDIACNSVAAGAKLVSITVAANTAADSLEITVSDDGRGMSEDFLKTVTDPFSTTRTTRKVGMGIPLFKMAAELSGGEFAIESRQGEGTVTRASFKISSVDRVPLGDLAGTITALIGMAADADLIFGYSVDGRAYKFDTREVKAVLETTDLNDSQILLYLKQMIEENISTINGGLII